MRWSLPTIYSVTSPSAPLLTMYVHMHMRVSPFPCHLHPSVPRFLHIFSLSLSFNMFKSLAPSSASLSSYRSVSLLPVRGTMHEMYLYLLSATSLHTSKVTTTLWTLLKSPQTPKVTILGVINPVLLNNQYYSAPFHFYCHHSRLSNIIFLVCSSPSYSLFFLHSEQCLFMLIYLSPFPV